jgi:hypothetical protein
MSELSTRFKSELFSWHLKIDPPEATSDGKDTKAQHDAAANNQWRSNLPP